MAFRGGAALRGAAGVLAAAAWAGVVLAGCAPGAGGAGASGRAESPRQVFLARDGVPFYGDGRLLEPTGRRGELFEAYYVRAEAPGALLLAEGAVDPRSGAHAPGRPAGWVRRDDLLLSRESLRRTPGGAPIRVLVGLGQGDAAPAPLSIFRGPGSPQAAARQPLGVRVLYLYHSATPSPGQVWSLVGPDRFLPGPRASREDYGWVRGDRVDVLRSGAAFLPRPGVSARLYGSFSGAAGESRADSWDPGASPGAEDGPGWVLLELEPRDGQDARVARLAAVRVEGREARDAREAFVRLDRGDGGRALQRGIFLDRGELHAYLKVLEGLLPGEAGLGPGGLRHVWAAFARDAGGSDGKGGSLAAGLEKSTGVLVRDRWGLLAWGPDGLLVLERAGVDEVRGLLGGLRGEWEGVRNDPARWVRFGDRQFSVLPREWVLGPEGARTARGPRGRGGG